MLYLLLALTCSVALSVAFKLFPRYGIDTYQAIVYNYVVCVLTGALFLGELPWSADIAAAPWQPFALGLGVLFMGGFLVAALTVRHFGIAVASVVQRMSLVLSVPFAVWFIGEPGSWQKLLGVVLALCAVLLTNAGDSKRLHSPDEPPQTGRYGLLVYPVLIFLASGVIECVLQYVQTYTIQQGSSDGALFSIYTFGYAALTGAAGMAVLLLKGKMRLGGRHLLAGILLGIPNYFSIFFLIQSFSYLDKSAALPINNIGILVSTALLGFFLFGERLRPVNWLGIALAITAIVLVLMVNG